MELHLIVRRPLCNEDGELERERIAKLARRVRELAEEELGEEIVVDVVPDRDHPMTTYA